MSEPVTVPQADDLVGTVFKGLTWASAASWEQSGLMGGSWGYSPFVRWQGAPGLGKVSLTQRGLLSQMWMAFPQNKMSVFIGELTGPRLGLGTLSGTGGAARESCFP